MTKPIILEIDNVRIGKWNEENYFIEREETYYSPKDKKEITGYRFKGYYSSVLGALRAVSIKGLLVDEQQNCGLNGTLKQTIDSNQKLFDAIEQIKGERMIENDQN